MKNLGYDARLRRWGINRPNNRHVRGDSIKMYNSVNGLDKTNFFNF